jgi:hypothetical protein
MPSSRTLPLILTSRTKSFILFKHRRNVLLPHPDGPMNAVTEFASMPIDISFNAGGAFLEYAMHSDFVIIFASFTELAKLAELAEFAKIAKKSSPALYCQTP